VSISVFHSSISLPLSPTTVLTHNEWAFFPSYLLREEGDDLGADRVQPLDDLRLQDREVGADNTHHVSKIHRRGRGGVLLRQPKENVS